MRVGPPPTDKDNWYELRNWCNGLYNDLLWFGVGDRKNTEYLSQHDSFESAITALGTTDDARLFIDKDVTMTGNVTIGSNIQLIPIFGNIITTGGNTLTINGTITAERFQIFDGTGVVFGYSVDVVYPEWWGASADPITPTDDINAFDRAFASLKGGGTVLISGASQYYLASDLDMPTRTTLMSPRQWVGSRSATDMLGAASESALTRPQSADTGGGVIYLSDTASIEMDKGCGLKGLVVVRRGVELPADATEVATWTGTAVTSPDSRHNMLIEKCAFIGFDLAISFPGADDGDPWTGQNRIEDVLIDCSAGIYINGSLDVCYINRVHCWPFGTVNLSGKVDADSQRSGTAFFIDDSNDWTKFTDCFSYGYLRGFYVLDSHSVTLLNCGTDYTSTMTGEPVGFKVSGASADLRVIGFQAAGQYHGANISTTSGNGTVQFIGCTFWDIDSNGIVLDDGDMVVVGCKFRDLPQGIGINSGNAGRVIVDDCLFDTVSTACFAEHASHDKSYWNVGDNNVFIDCTAVVNGTFDLPSFADADLTPDVTNGKKWKTGCTTARTLTDFDGDLYEGKEIIIIGADGGNTTIQHNVSYINLTGGANRALADGDTMHLIWDGADWDEVG